MPEQPPMPPLPKINVAEVNKQIQAAAQIALAPILFPVWLINRMNRK
jgi:hypothetical protein